MNDESGPQAAHVNASPASASSIRLGNDIGRLIRHRRRRCRQLDDLLGCEHYPHPAASVPVISMREVA